MNRSDQHPPPLPTEQRPGCILVGFALLLAVGLVHGGLGFAGYLVNEHRRLSAFEVLLLWLGDAIGLFWFLRYVIRWRLGWIEEAPRRLADARFPRSAWIMLASMGLGFAAESAATLSLRHQEIAGYQRAVAATCLVETVIVNKAAGGPTFWILDGRYQDGAGNWYPVTYYLNEKDQLPRLPAAVLAEIQKQQTPIRLPIVYDPQRPGRNWIPQLGWDDRNRLHYFSIAFLLFQFLFTLLFVTLLKDSIRLHHQLPWWHELYNLIPAGNAGIFAGTPRWN